MNVVFPLSVNQFKSILDEDGPCLVHTLEKTQEDTSIRDLDADYLLDHFVDELGDLIVLNFMYAIKLWMSVVLLLLLGRLLLLDFFHHY